MIYVAVFWHLVYILRTDLYSVNTIIIRIKTTLYIRLFIIIIRDFRMYMHVIKQIYYQIMNYLHLVGARIRLIYFFGNKSFLLGILISYTIWSSPKMHFALKGKKDLLSYLSASLLS